VPEGELVGHLQRDAKGQLIQTSSVAVQQFPQIQFSDENIAEILRPATDQSLTQLWKQLPHSKPDKRVKVLTAFYQRC